jgi:murein L,D-transpeptidase YcbB/YkuD
MSFRKSNSPNKFLAISLIIIATIWLSGTDSLWAADETDPPEGSLSEVIEQVVTGGKKLTGEEFRTEIIMKEFYQGRNFKPVWIKGSSTTSQVQDLIKALKNASDEGISPKLYRIDTIEEIVEASKDKKLDITQLARLELLLTDAFFAYGFHLSYGVLDPFTFKVRWFVPEGESVRHPVSDTSPSSSAALDAVLEKALKSNRIKDTLLDLAPKTTKYENLRKALAEYREMVSKEEWPKVPAGPKLKVGDKSERVIALRNRLGLHVTKETMEKEPADADLFDEELEGAVKKFQEEHGLEPDGVLGVGTVMTMNVPVEKRVCQIAANMDRLRSMHSFFEEPNHIIVNVPQFELEALKEGSPPLRSRVVVGQVGKKTPLLTAQVEHLIFSPQWHVPRSIMVEEKLPLIRKDPSYVRRNRMRMYDNNGVQVDPSAIDWSGVSRRNMSYHIVQESGDFNALGRVKFIFPNPYDVYLHDTPSKSLFQKEVRTLSHGCIRVQKPVELAELLLNDKPEWDRKKITEAMNCKGELVVPLTDPLPIHVIYLTAWVDEGGLKLLNDVYGFDRNYEKYVCAE